MRAQTHYTHCTQHDGHICVHIHMFMHAADVSAFMETHFRRSISLSLSIYIYTYMHLYVLDYSLH